LASHLEGPEIMSIPTKLIMALGVLASAGADRPVRHAGAVIDARQYGAKPDGQTDSRAAIQTAVDQAAAQGGGDVILYGGPAPYAVSAPVSIRGLNVRLMGVGSARMQTLGAYGGPILAIGLPARRGTFGPEYRPSVERILDRSTTAPGAPKRYGLATRGKGALALTGHPLQFGPIQKNGAPDYWGGGGSLTIDLCVARPERATWPDGTAILGLADSWGQPAPWVIRAKNEGFALDLKCDEPEYFEQGGYHRVLIRTDVRRRIWRISVQVNLDQGRAQAWVDGQAVESGLLDEMPERGKGRRPGLKLKPHDGVTPFAIAHVGPRVAPRPQDITDLTLYGLRVVRGEVYQWDNPRQALKLSPQTPVTDEIRFFATQPTVVPAGSVVAWLPLDDAPDGAPWIHVNQEARSGLLFWVPPIGITETDNITIQDLRLEGAMQPAIMTAQHLSLRVENVVSRASQGLGALPIMVGYPVILERCQFSGFDAAVVLFWQILTARNVTLGMIGRDGVRCFGGSSSWEDTFVVRAVAHTETIFRFQGNDDGGLLEIRRCMVDNEEANVIDAIVSCESGRFQRGRLIVDGLDVSQVRGTSSMIHLIGHKLSSGRGPYRVQVSNTSTFGPCKTALRVDGPPNWHGTFDASMLWPAGVAGDPESLKRIKIDPPTDLYEPDK
jgi:hypothetical protein